MSNYTNLRLLHLDQVTRETVLTIQRNIALRTLKNGRRQIEDLTIINAHEKLKEAAEHKISLCDFEVFVTLHPNLIADLFENGSEDTQTVENMIQAYSNFIMGCDWSNFDEFRDLMQLQADLIWNGRS